MATPPVNTTSVHLDLQTWILRVYIHCDGCKKKVLKILQSIDGVYKTEIDSKQHKATVTGSVDGDTILKKLLKSGKHAEILPESFQAPAPGDADSGNSKKKKKQNNKQKDGVTAGDGDKNADEEKKESEAGKSDGNDGGNNQETAPSAAAAAVNGQGGGKKKNKKNKKKKGDKKENKTTPDGDDDDGLPPGIWPADTGIRTENVGASMEQFNLIPPRHRMVYPTPYDVAPYQNYYPTPAYGLSYNTSYPSTESSYYTPPVYGYAQAYPSVHYPPQPPPSYYPRSAFDYHDDANQDGKGCTIM